MPEWGYRGLASRSGRYWGAVRGSFSLGGEFVEHGRLLTAEGGEAEAFKEADLAGDGEYFLDPAAEGALAAEFDQAGGDAAVLKIGVDGQGSDFGDALGVDLEGATADDFASAGGDEEGGDAGEVALDELVREEADQGSDGGHVLGNRWAYRKRHWE